MLKHWRTAEYTDDGCSVYECLSCKAQWEARTSPEHAHWRFCPVCGIGWHGRLPLDHERTEHSWNRKQSRWPTDKAREIAKLLKPTWQLYYRSNFLSDGAWEPDGEPFQGSAQLALSWVNNKKRDNKNQHGHWVIEYKIEPVKTAKFLPLP